MEIYPIIRTEGRNTLELIFMFISMADIPLTIGTLILIITKTPPQMRTYKWIVFNLTATAFVTDFVICFLFDPIPLFPEAACYSRTWIANTFEDGNYVMLCASVIMLQLTLSSTLIAFIYRMKCVIFSGLLRNIPQNYLLHLSAIIYVISLIPIVVILVVFYKPRSQMRQVVLEVPQLRFLEKYGSYLATTRSDPDFIKFQIIWLSSAFSLVGLCIIVAAITILYLQMKRHSMSPKSLRLHRSLTIHLLVQIFIPVITTFIPLIILFSTRYVAVPFGAEFWNLIISQTVALHSPLSSLAILFSTAPYRRIICKACRNISSVFNTQKIGPKLCINTMVESKTRH